MAILAVGAVLGGCGQEASERDRPRSPWSAPTEVPLLVEATVQAIVGNGSRLLLMPRANGSALYCRDRTGATPMVSVPRRGRFEDRETPGFLLAGPVPARPDRAVVLLTSGCRRARMATVTAGGRVRTLAVVPKVAAGYDVSLAASPRGDVALAWVTETAGRFRVRLHRQSADGALRRNQAVGEVQRGDERDPGIVSVAAALGPRGELVLAVARASDRAVAVATAEPGRALSRFVTVGRHKGVIDLRAAVARTGRAVVTWSTQDTGEERNVPLTVVAAVREPRAGRFGRAQTLDAGVGAELDPAAGLEVAMTPDGSATVLWTTPLDSADLLFAATAQPGRPFAEAQRLPDDGRADDGRPGGLGVGPSGEMLAAWARNGRILVSLRRPGANRFGRPEDVVVAPAGTVRDPVVAFDPSTGAPTVAWAANSRAQRRGEPDYLVPDVVRFSRRRPFR